MTTMEKRQQHFSLLQSWTRSTARGNSLDGSLSNAARRDDFNRTVTRLVNFSRGYEKAFPEILHLMISDPYQEAIKWKEHGLSFIIQDRKAFIERVLPQYFGQATKFTSFTRKLQRWKFHRIPSGPEEGSWFNEQFARDSTAAELKAMKCAPRKQENKNKKVPKIKEAISSKRGVNASPPAHEGCTKQAPLILPSREQPVNNQLAEKLAGHKMPLKKRTVDPSLFLYRIQKETRTAEQQHMLLLLRRYRALSLMVAASSTSYY